LSGESGIVVEAKGLAGISREILPYGGYVFLVQRPSATGKTALAKLLCVAAAPERYKDYGLQDYVVGGQAWARVSIPGHGAVEIRVSGGRVDVSGKLEVDEEIKDYMCIVLTDERREQSMASITYGSLTVRDPAQELQTIAQRLFPLPAHVAEKRRTAPQDIEKLRKEAANLREQVSRLREEVKRLEGERQRLKAAANLSTEEERFVEAFEAWQKILASAAEVEKRLEEINKRLSDLAPKDVPQEKVNALAKRISELGDELAELERRRERVEKAVRAMRYAAEHLEQVLDAASDQDVSTALFMSFSDSDRDFSTVLSYVASKLNEAASELADKLAREVKPKAEELSKELERLKGQYTEALRVKEEVNKLRAEKERKLAEKQELARVAQDYAAKVRAAEEKWDKSAEELYRAFKSSAAAPGRLGEVESALSSARAQLLTLEKLLEKTEKELREAEDRAGELEEVRKVEAEVQRKRDEFRGKYLEVFMKHINDIVPGGFKTGRAYSTSERALITVLHSVSVIAAAASQGVRPPYVVVDLARQLDSRFREMLLKVLKTLRGAAVPVYLFETADGPTVTELE